MLLMTLEVIPHLVAFPHACPLEQLSRISLPEHKDHHVYQI